MKRPSAKIIRPNFNAKIKTPQLHKVEDEMTALVAKMATFTTLQLVTASGLSYGTIRKFRMPAKIGGTTRPQFNTMQRLASVFGETYSRRASNEKAKLIAKA